MSAPRDWQADLALCEAATPGPWSSMVVIPYVIEAQKKDDGLWHAVCRVDNDCDLAFISASRTGWPAAIREAMKVPGLEAELAALQERHRFYSAGIENAINMGPPRMRRHTGEPARPDYVEVIHLANLAKRAECAEAEVARLKAWQLEIARGMGYCNTGDGVDGYEVADPGVILAAWNDYQDRATDTADAARADAAALREALREVLAFDKVDDPQSGYQVSVATLLDLNDENRTGDESALLARAEALLAKEVDK